MNFERAYDLAFPDDPIREYFKPIYKSIDDKYNPIIEEYGRLLRQCKTEDTPKIIVDNNQETLWDVIKKFIRLIIECFSNKSLSTYPEMSATVFQDEIYNEHIEEKENKLHEYCLSRLSLCVDQSLPFEITTYDWKQCPELSKNQVSVYLYIPDYNFIKSIEDRIEKERQSPSPNEDIVYAYGGRGNQVAAVFSNTISELYRSLERAKNNLSVVYREVICINPMWLVETRQLPTEMQR